MSICPRWYRKGEIKVQAGETGRWQRPHVPVLACRNTKRATTAPLLGARFTVHVTAVMGHWLLVKDFAAPRAENPVMNARADEAEFNYIRYSLLDVKLTFVFCRYFCSVKFLL